MPRLIRITTVPLSLKFLIKGQMKYMSEHGFDVTMMSADGSEIQEVVDREQCQHIIIPFTRRITPFADLKSLWKLYFQLKKINPTIVHTHTPKAGLIGMMASWLSRVPIRLHTVAGLPLESTTGAKRKLLLFIEKVTYFCATEIWPNSDSLKTFILDHELTKKTKIQVIGRGSSNGIDISDFNISTLNQQKLKEIRQSISYNSDNKYLLFVGRIVRDKGIEELVRVFQSLSTTDKTLRLILVGPLEPELDPLSEETINIINKNESILLTGFSNDVKYYMHLADLFVFPSHREGFPNVPMQAALMDCPLVISRINGNIDIVEHMETGLLHEKSNVADLEEKILFAIKHTNKVMVYANALKHKIQNNFERSIIHQLILERYHHLLDALSNEKKI